MEPAGSYQGMMISLDWQLRDGGSKLIGVVFAHPHAALVEAEITPTLPYFHVRSGSATVFYFAGYFDEKYPCPSKASRVPGQAGWRFGAEAFNDFRSAIESRSRWRYSGGSDLILVTARRERSAEHGVALDWSSALAVNLERAKAEGAILTVSMFFERVFQSAEEHRGANQAVRLSDDLGGSVAKRALWNALVSFLPEAVRDDARIARHFVTEDLSPRDH